ncbi:MAG: sulfotransferase [Candidatus Hodarchaeota archaeon]
MIKDFFSTSGILRYGNFRDPLGLLIRMIRSDDRAAHFILFRTAITYLLAPFDFVLQPFETQRLKKSSPSSLPILLIVGVPRSGTTLLYQVLADCLPLSYFNNLSSLFPRSPISAGFLFNRYLNQKGQRFTSYYGNTAGFSAPNDGFHVWNRWLGKDRYSAPEQIDHAAKGEMRRFFNAWLSTFNKPFLNKNNRNTDCVSLLAETLDNTYFIECRRNPLYTAQSLIIARQQIQGSKVIGWGLHAKNSNPGRGPLGYVDAVCDQIYEVEIKLRDDKKRIGEERFIEVSYERFCEDPFGAVQLVSKRILGRDLDDKPLRSHLKPFESTNKMRIKRSEFDRIQSRLRELYGVKFSAE